MKMQSVARNLFGVGAVGISLALGCSSSGAPNATVDAGLGEAGATGEAGEAGSGAEAGSTVTCTAAVADDGNPCTMDWCDSSSGPVHMALAAGTACADKDVCNGAESCDAKGVCAAGTPLIVDDGDVCTTDACDSTTGVSHIAEPGCDRLPTLSGGRYETRASLLGIVHSADGAAISGYAVTVFEVPVSGAARSDLSVTTQSDGSFRARLTSFPETTPPRTPPLHVLIRIAATGFLTIEREAFLRPGDATNLGKLTMIPSDSAVTMIGPEGGTATDSNNLVSVDIPPGAVSSAIPVRITPIANRDQFPFPLPGVTATMYGVVLEPDGQKFAVPAQLHFANYRNLPTSLSVPVGSFDEVNARWIHSSFATWDGHSFATHISHFSNWDANAMVKPPGVWLYNQTGGADPRKSKGTTCVGSSAAFGSGALEQDFAAAHYKRQGRDYDVTLHYDSGLAGSVTYSTTPSTPVEASGISGVSIGIAMKTVVATCVPVGTAGTGSQSGCGGGSCTPGATLSLGFNQLSVSQRGLGSQNDDVQESLSPTALGIGSVESFDLPVNADGTAPAPGYFPFDRIFTGGTTGGGSCIGSGAGSVTVPFGVQNNSAPGVTATVDPGPQVHLETYELVYHRRSSNYGAGWGISEVGEAYVAPDQGQADVVQGDGEKESFRLRPTISIASTALSGERTAMAVDPVTGERMLLGTSGVVQKLNGDGTVQTVATAALTSAPFALAIAYTPAGRQFVAALSNALVTFDQSGNVKTLAPLAIIQNASLTDKMPGLAASGSFAYLTNAEDNQIYRFDLSTATPVAQAITAGDSGDPSADPTVAAIQTAIQTPRGLAIGPDGSLYVASEESNLVYRLSPQPDGTVGPNSQVSRAVGSGEGSVLPPLGAALSAAQFPLKEPLQLSFAPDGTLFIVTLYGAATYDPATNTGRLLAVDVDLSNLFRLVLAGNGSFIPLSATSAYFKVTAATELLRMDVGLASEYAPTRTLTIGSSGVTVTDSGTELVESYTWIDALQQRALLTSRARRTGELLQSVRYVSGTDRIDSIKDPTGGLMKFAYDGSGKLHSITDAANHSTQFSVNGAGDLAAMFLPTGEERQFTYKSHRMASAMAPNGASSQYTYNDNGTLSQAIRPGGGASTLSAAFAKPTQLAPDGTFLYPATFTDDRGVTHAILVDAAGQVERDTYAADGTAYDVQQVLATGLTAPIPPSNPIGLTQFPLDNHLLRIATTTINGVPVTGTETYDSLGRPTLSNLPGGSYSSSGANARVDGRYYDENGRLAAYGPGSAVFISTPNTPSYNGFGFEHDSNGRVSRVFDDSFAGVSGRQTTYTWNSDGQPSAITSHNVATKFAYDPLTGNISASTNAFGGSTWTYDNAGNVATQSDGTTTLTYGHDAGNRLTSIQDALGNQTTLGYGQGSCGCPNGAKLTSLHTPDLPASAQWAFAYNADGLLSSSSDPTGASHSLSYTPTRDVASVTDGLHRQTLFTYDQLGRQKTITDPLKRVGAFAYPVPGNSVIAGPSVYAGSPSNSPAPTDLNAALSDGQYQVGQNYFSTASFPARVEFYRDSTFAFSLGRNFDYDRRLALRGDRVGLPFAGSQILPAATSQYRHQLFSYINNNDWSSLLSVAESDYGDHYEFEENNFNTELDLTSNKGWTVNTANYNFTRDTAGRPIGVATRFQGAINGLTVGFDGPDVAYAYNPGNGQLTTVTNGSGTQGLGYDARGLLKTINLSYATQTIPQTEGVFTFQYDAVGRNTRLDYPDGHFRTQSYDLAGRLTSRCYDGYPAPAPARCYSAQYDAEGNPTTLDDPEGKNEITYDALDRVTQVWRTPKGGSRTLEEDYTYNALGALSKNVDTVVDDERPLLSGAGTASAGIPATHKGQPVTLDPGGQVTALDGASLVFNKRAWLTNIGQGATNENYGYDAFSRRVMRDTGGVTGDFYSYEGANIVAVTNSASSNGSVPSAVQRRILYEGVDQPLWMYDATLASSVYFEVDTIGNVRRVRGGKPITGTPLASDLGGYRYTAFGHLVTTDATTPYPAVAGQRYDQPLRWQSHWFLDVGPGLYDFRARVWSPELATFLQPDEFGYLTHAGTLWSWPGQNPYRWRDPSGRDAEEWFLRNADGLQAGAEAISGAAIVIATGGLAGEALGFGSLDATLGALGLSAASGAGSIAVSSGAAATTAVVADAAENECAAVGETADAAAEGLEAAATAEKGFFEGTQYTEKVIAQMKGGVGEFHSFPESVTAFENAGTVKTITGGDGVVRQMLEIPGSYGGRDGVFQFIKEADGTINHRLFVPVGP